MNTRDTILSAALDVVREEGLVGFTQPRVAHRAGLRQSHLTYYFPTRRDLLSAVVAAVVQQRIEAIRGAFDRPEPADRITALASVLTDPAQTRLLLALTQSADRDAVVRDMFRDLGAGVVPLGRELFDSLGIAVTSSSLQLLQATATGIAVLALAAGGIDEAHAGTTSDTAIEDAAELLTALITSLPRADTTV